ncbi:ribosome biogenesis GTP-binding protein YihA/YsxC [Rheinheimera baltica]|uniref:Probable GTP-binding protein EngB n=1 Tax=Rheinheimera baltica TaxID=67576 RepID=A0ABT9HVG9_9GAMM|nr:ribosome biogenesis GTP-binding protein YihA/YsxC [Rheinheimera baltica]MDP5135124.1 ribosome biogenesis GTP-binding protein YihA/YsxC [Rheinheimera baltica]MDP5143594.1 ribosome biogenesis GTP-binding protein YihA/YsxC [Rheinheimera baltica]MDP5151052.1 ribosome biogenesis GTP-binding protein YihA/YsxC [Rheinheimera baltica]MDP5189759.1 ribosome biogenesis GTP-binding protein YihA/YsxC [Rheinheimera baltica]
MYKSKINYQRAAFLTSAPDIKALPADAGIEVAFAGRSNAGKSSALNTLTRQNSLARTSKTPGRTQLINTFSLDEHRRLIDLPGYGFAKVPLAVKEKWQKSLAEYLTKRASLKGIVVLMDIRHPLKDLDQDLIHWAVDSELPVLILLTKSDKLGPGARKKTLFEVRDATLAFMGDITVHTFSSLNKQGLADLEQVLDLWYQAPDATSDIAD